MNQSDALHIKFVGHRILSVWEECVGVLNRFIPYEGGLLATVGDLEIYLPTEIEAILSQNIGQKIGIIRADSGYRFRLVEGGRHEKT